MSRQWGVSRAVLGAALLLLAPGSLPAQSLLGTSGLGFPQGAVDARSRALGGEGVGLKGGYLNPAGLAAAAGLLLPTATFTLQPQWASGSLGEESVDSQGMRFPLIGLAYPIGRFNGMVTLTLGSFMDQRWEVQEEGTEIVAGTPTPVTDVFKSNGGVSAVQLGWAQRLGSAFAVSVSGGLHTGSVTRTFIRTFDSLTVGTGPVQSFTDGGKWQYGGPMASVGVLWDPADFLRLAGSVTWSGDLEADPTEDTLGEAAEYALPAVYRFGASGVLMPRLSVSLGMSYADWSPTEAGLEPETVVGGVWSLGGGVEWEASGFGNRTLPIRLGLRKADLPFLFEGEAPSETTYSGGVGVNLTQAEDFILAGVDLAVERGSREAGSLTEDFWRATVSFRVSGW